jgi:hypothetical protein
VYTARAVKLVVARVLLLFFALAAASSAHAQTDECVEAHADAQLRRMHGALLLDAHARWLACAQPECPKRVANDCAAWLGEVEDSLSSLVFAVSHHDDRDYVYISADGKPIAEHVDDRALAVFLLSGKDERARARLPALPLAARRCGFMQWSTR